MNEIENIHCGKNSESQTLPNANKIMKKMALEREYGTSSEIERGTIFLESVFCQ